MAKILRILSLFALALLLCSCQKGKVEASRLIEESQTLRDEGDIKGAKEKLYQARELAPNFPEVYLELGILVDEYFHNTDEAVPHYEKFLELSDNEEMKEKVRAWLEDAKKGMALPFEAVNELSPEAKELLDKRTEQFEVLRRQLVDRYESEIAKLREGGVTTVVTVVEVKETPAPVTAAAVETTESKTEAPAVEAKPETVVAEVKPEEPKLSKAELKKLEEEKKKEAERLAKEKKEHDQKIDAFVKNIVKAGSDAAASTVITASELPKVPEKEANIELELTEEEVTSNIVAQTEAPPEKKETAEPPKEKEPRIHIVGQGDNLGNISRKYYGEFRRWKEIAEANKEILPDPNKLKIGMKLVIPE